MTEGNDNQDHIEVTINKSKETDPEKIFRKGQDRFFWGFVLLALGILLLLRQFTGLDFENWWALFILIPAFGSFSAAWYAATRAGRINEAARSSFGSGLIILTVALMFLFNLDWEEYWPLMVIVPAFNIFLNGFPLPGSKEYERPYHMRIYRPWSAWIGLGGMILGAGFLVHNLGIFDPAQYYSRWWALPILIPALGGIVTELVLILRGKLFGFASFGNVIATLVFAVTGLIAFFGLDWNYLWPIFLIGIGLIILVGVTKNS